MKSQKSKPYFQFFTRRLNQEFRRQEVLSFVLQITEF
ncbi:hypothetical protein ZOSMA_310G00100 [Zostera marina]|uniref:Uncharacterized protein n=1 Tax=Zostera marina TaxID=29655 RepID=A0A0K9P9S0_ZOSMR|nr:hypothetical protein ZOSMA_310G00100 [Zostera marina]